MAIFGMRGTGSFVQGEDPESHREGIMRLFPNGDATLVGITSMLPSTSIKSKIHNWWTKVFQGEAGTITGIFTDSALASAYVSGAASAAVLYVKLSQADADHFVKLSHVVLRNGNDLAADVTAKVVDVVRNGANSYLQVELREADDNSATSDLSDATEVLNIGSIYAEGADVGQSRIYQPTPYSNYMHIHRTPVKGVGTITNGGYDLRTGDPWEEDQREGLQYHAVQLEKMLQFSEKLTFMNGDQREYTAQGILPFLRAYYPSSFIDYRKVTTFNGQTFTGKTWEQAGELFIDAVLAHYSTYASGHEILVLSGANAIMGLNRIAKSNGIVQLSPMSTDYGLKFSRWTNPHSMEILIKSYTHYTINATMKNCMLFLVPENVRWVYKEGRDTNILENRQSPGVDGRIDEWMTEWTLELGHPEMFLFLAGIGQDNTAS